MRHYPTFANLSKQFDISESYANKIYHYILSLVNTENLATTEFDPQLAVVFDIRCRSTKGNEKSPNVSQDRVNWTSTMADRILPVGNGGVLGSSKSMSKMRVNPYRDRAKSFYQRYALPTVCQARPSRYSILQCDDTFHFVGTGFCRWTTHRQ